MAEKICVGILGFWAVIMVVGLLIALSPILLFILGFVLVLGFFKVLLG